MRVVKLVSDNFLGATIPLGRIIRLFTGMRYLAVVICQWLGTEIWRIWREVGISECQISFSLFNWLRGIETSILLS